MIYLDNNATTKPLSSIPQIVSKYLSEEYGNPSSTSYELGRNAKAAVETARTQVAELVDCEPDEVIFTSGGTEAISLALLGRAVLKQKPDKIILSPIEHPAVNESIKTIENIFGTPHTKLEISKEGELIFDQIDLEKFSLSSTMLANNETGIISDLTKFSNADFPNLFTHVDTVQAIGKIDFSFRKSNFNAIAIAGHKIYAPKGVGALILKRDSDWQSISTGGGQESRRRGGTENVALIAALGEAAKVVKKRLLDGEEEKTSVMRDQFEDLILNEFPAAKIIGKTLNRLPNTTALIIPGIIGYQIVEKLATQGVYISAGSACKSGTTEPSKTLSAMGYDITEALSFLRISFGFNNTMDECKESGKIIVNTIKKDLENKNKKLEELLNG